MNYFLSFNLEPCHGGRLLNRGVNCSRLLALLAANLFQAPQNSLRADKYFTGWLERCSARQMRIFRERPKALLEARSPGLVFLRIFCVSKTSAGHHGAGVD